MNSSAIFSVALNVQSPWKLNTVDFTDTDAGPELHIHIGFEKGSNFSDENGQVCSVHDTQPRKWRHLNFFQHKCYIHCNVPRIKTSDGKVKLVEVPWARPQSGFTLLFEGFIMALIENEMPLNKIGKIINENAHRIWTIFNYWIEKSYASDQPSKISKLGIDETSRRKGHKYITLAVDLDARRVIHITEGKGKDTIDRVANYMQGKGLDVSQIKHVSMDMSPSFISGVRKNFPDAKIHFDRFHVVKLLNEAMDAVRKQERKEHSELKGAKYIFLRNKKNLSQAKAKQLEDLITLLPTLGTAYRLKELFNDLWDQPDRESALIFLDDWFSQVDAAEINAFQEFAKTVRTHLAGIVNFCGTRINNGILEGINTKIQLAKRRARGYRLTKNFINMAYFLCGKLKFDYPLYSS